MHAGPGAAPHADRLFLPWQQPDAVVDARFVAEPPPLPGEKKSLEPSTELL